MSDKDKHQQVPGSEQDVPWTSEADYRAIFDAANDAIFVHDTKTGDILDINRKATEMFGYTPEEARQINIEVLGTGEPPYARADVIEWLRKASKEGPQLFEWRARAKSGNIFWAEVNLKRATIGGKDCLLAVVRDITERKQTVEEMHKLNRTLRMLSDANQVLVRASNESTLLKEICNIIAEVGSYRMVWIGYTEHDEAKSVRPVAYAGHEEGYFNIIKMTWADNELGYGPAGMAICTGKPAFSLNIAKDPAFSPWREEAIKRGYASFIAIPLIANGQALGVLGLYSDQPCGFDDEEVRLLTELANDLAFGIASIRAREERRQAVESLVKSEEQYRSLIELFPDTVVVHSHDKALFANPAAAEMFRAPSAEYLVGESVLEHIHPDYREIVKERVRQMMELGRKSPPLEEKYIRLDGTVVDVEVVSMPTVFNGQLSVIAVSRDITERKMAEQRRKEMEAHKRDFYRRTILAATGAKLDITERRRIMEIAGPPVMSWEIRRKEDVSVIRADVTKIIQSAGMEESRLYDFILAVGESTTNVLKHVGYGTASLRRRDDVFMFIASDRGHGIDALALPEVALKRGYTTAVSLGMGYKAMISVADKVYLATGPGGTTVAIEMSIRPAEKPPSIANLPDTWGD